MPAANLLGERGRGFAQFLQILDEGRIADRRAGHRPGPGLRGRVRTYAGQRHAFGQPIGAYQAIQFKIADMDTRAHTARLAWYDAARAARWPGEPYKRQAAIAKLYASEIAVDNAREATQIHGGYGFMNESPVARFWRDAKMLEIGEGTSEVQRMIIARELGLPGAGRGRPRGLGKRGRVVGCPGASRAGQVRVPAPLVGARGLGRRPDRRGPGRRAGLRPPGYGRPARPDAESVLAERRIGELVADGPVVFAVVDGVDVYDPAVVRSVSDASARIRALAGVVDVDDLYTGPGGRVGIGNRSTLVRVELAEGLDPLELEAAEDRVRAALETIEAPSVLVGGDHLTERAFGDQALRDLAAGESVALVLLVVALVVILGGALAASLPMAVAVVGIAATLLVLLVVSAITEVGEYSVNIVTLLGLGLAVDYTLLILARYREERAAGAGAASAIDTAMTRAGRAVAFSGVAVAAALAGLSVFAEPLLASMALGGTAVVLLTTALALTAVPALLAVAGERIPPAGARTWVTRAARARYPPGRAPPSPARTPLLGWPRTRSAGRPRWPR